MAHRFSYGTSTPIKATCPKRLLRTLHCCLVHLLNIPRDSMDRSMQVSPCFAWLAQVHTRNDVACCPHLEPWGWGRGRGGRGRCAPGYGGVPAGRCGRGSRWSRVWCLTDNKHTNTHKPAQHCVALRPARSCQAGARGSGGTTRTQASIQDPGTARILRVQKTRPGPLATEQKAVWTQ